MFSPRKICGSIAVVACAVAVSLGVLSGPTSAFAATTTAAHVGSAAGLSPASSGTKSYALRDRCGGANGNVAWGGTGASAWGIVWTLHSATCGTGTHWVELVVNGSDFLGAGAAAPGAGVGYNIGPSNTSDGQPVGEIQVFLCSSETGGACNDSRTWFV
jgi:hypothetical protein